MNTKAQLWDCAYGNFADWLHTDDKIADVRVLYCTRSVVAPIKYHTFCFFFFFANFICLCLTHRDERTWWSPFQYITMCSILNFLSAFFRCQLLNGDTVTVSPASPPRWRHIASLHFSVCFCLVLGWHLLWWLKHWHLRNKCANTICASLAVNKSYFDSVLFNMSIRRNAQKNSKNNCKNHEIG